jgi:ATP-dependent Clp protease ATP-binding subunit ClpX
MEEAMLEVMYEVPSKPGVKEIVVNDDVVNKGDHPLIVYEKEAELAGA